MVKRWFIYFREMFPLQKYLPFIFFTFSAIYGVTQLMAQRQIIQIGYRFWAGMATVFMMTLLMRIFDEFKDRETDSKLFPGRALSRGAVRYSDIKVLGWLVFFIMVVLNFLIPQSWIPFLLMLAYGFLTLKWFFRKEKISTNLILAFVTHQPMVLFIYAYVVAVSIPDSQFNMMVVKVVPSVLSLFLTVSAWEISRKVRATGKETEYITYSKLYGPRKATLLALSFLTISIACDCLAGHVFHFQIWFYITYIIMTLVYSFFFIRFMFVPSDRNLSLLPVAEAASILIPLVYFFQILYLFPIKL